MTVFERARARVGGSLHRSAGRGPTPPAAMAGRLAGSQSVPLCEAIGVRYRPAARIGGCGAPIQSATLPYVGLALLDLK
jgi:hypothetical protein